MENLFDAWWYLEVIRHNKKPNVRRIVSNILSLESITYFPLWLD